MPLNSFGCNGWGNSLLLKRSETYNEVKAIIVNQNLMWRWQEAWIKETKGRWTMKLIPEILKWVNRDYSETFKPKSSISMIKKER